MTNYLQPTCDHVNCGSSLDICQLVHGRPRCVCDRNCTKVPNLHTGIVCGYDGKTYRSECSLFYNNCQLGRFDDVYIDYFGQCQFSCDNVACPHGKQCMMDQYGLTQCFPCLTECQDATSDEQKVCGVNGITYDSICHLGRATCIAGRSIKLAYTGACQPGLVCENITCPTSDHCLMNEASSTPICVNCYRECSGYTSGRRRNPVCGSDNVTYHSYCHMYRRSCNRLVVIDTKQYGECGSVPDPGTIIE